MVLAGTRTVFRGSSSGRTRKPCVTWPSCHGRSGEHVRAGSGPGPSPTSGGAPTATASAAADGGGRTVDASDAADVDIDVTDLAESAATADLMFESAERNVPVERIFRERGVESLNYRDEYNLRAALIEAESGASVPGEREGVSADTSRSVDAHDDPDAPTT